MFWSFVLPVMVVAAAAGLVARRWLCRFTYRLPDEVELPRRSHAWLVATIPIGAGLVALGLATHWPWWVAVGPAAFAVVWLVVASIDLDVGRLPNKFTLPLAAVAAAWALALGLATGDLDAIWRAWLAGVALAGVNLVLASLFRLIPPHQEGLGLGDIKLALSLGVVTGWFSWTSVVISFVATFVVGGIWAVVLLIARRKQARGGFSFGPSMVIGTIVALFVS